MTVLSTVLTFTYVGTSEMETAVDGLNVATGSATINSAFCPGVVEKARVCASLPLPVAGVTMRVMRLYGSPTGTAVKSNTPRLVVVAIRVFDTPVGEVDTSSTEALAINKGVG